MSFKWEMFDSDGKWITNALRFATEEEARMYGRDLRDRWTSMPEPARVAKSDDPVNYAIIDYKLVALNRGDAATNQSSAPNA